MTQYTIRLTDPARADIKSIYSYSKRTHGKKIADSYDGLIVQALKEIRKDPQRPGSRNRSDVAESFRSFHISLAKKMPSTQIKNPRHIIFYFTAEKDKIVVSRILHDARDHSRFMEDMRRDVMEQAKLPERNTPDKNRNR